MIITHTDKPVEIQYAYLNIFPDQFKSEKEKQEPSYVKNTLDYFANIAFAQYIKNRDLFVGNYDLMKGIINYQDFYDKTDSDTQSFMDQLIGESSLDDYVKHYPILNTPVNTLIGEQSKRPDNHRFRAFDDDSKSSELEYKTEILNQYILQGVREKLSEQNPDLKPDELEKMSFEQVKDSITDYTSTAEKWANNTLRALKAEFTMREKSEDAFRDLLISGREFFHIYEDTSKTGFSVEVLNPKNYWDLNTPDNKYTSAVSRQQNVPYANGMAHVMEISEIIEKFKWITKEEIDHLTSSLDNFGLLNVRESNLGTSRTGPDTIQYDTYSRLLLQERMMIEGEMKENNDELKNWLGLSNSTSSFGYKYSVIRSYHVSKKKIGLLTYVDDDGEEQSTLVDESYITSPNEVDIEWGWINQMYAGTRIGPQIYHLEPFNVLPYSPIIGLKYEQKNTTVKSLVDQMKPYQMIFNLAMNQLWNIAEKEWGVLYVQNLRKVPTPKDGDGQDALEVFKERAIRDGVVYEDDSPENAKAPTQNTNLSRAVNLSRSEEIQSRITIAQEMKELCWELVGVNRQRAGGAQATETATANTNALTQSFAQTEPWFVAHEYILDQLYQAIVDAAQYVQTQNPTSTVSFINGDGENSFLQVNTEDLENRDLKIFSVSRPEDQQLFQEFRSLSQAMLQNGATPYDIIVMYSSESMREIKKKFKNLKEEMEEKYQQEQQLKQQELEQQQKQFEYTQQVAQAERQYEIENDNLQKALDRLSKERIAIISATGYGKVSSEDSDGNGVQDVLEYSKLGLEQQNTIREHDAKIRDIQSRQQEVQAKLQVEREKLQVALKNQENDLSIAKINARNRAKPKAK